MSIREIKSLSIFNPPLAGDQFFLNGKLWTLRQDMNPTGWTLCDENNNRHAVIRRIPAMTEFIRLLVTASENS